MWDDTAVALLWWKGNRWILLCFDDVDVDVDVEVVVMVWKARNFQGSHKQGVKLSMIF